MKKQFYTALVVLFTGIVVLLSCNKETSCEGCRENNEPPIAVAGPDQVITLPADSISLDGSPSNDPDGTISEWIWKKISGPASFNIGNTTIAKTIVRNLDTGIYKFELKVTDDKGLSAKDTMQVTVNSVTPINRLPVANAGPDQTINFPTNGVMLDGSASSDPDNNITAYAWTKISGPSTFTITNTNATQTQVTNLVEGVYQFELKVTDAGGLFSTDIVQISVNPPITDPLYDVYVAGYESNGSQLLAKYWKNGLAISLTNGLTTAWANSIVVVGSDVYVAGRDGNVAKYWKNGVAISLTNGSTSASANSIAVAGNDVYVAGYENNVAKYWKNGVAISLTNGLTTGWANSIVVVGSDVYVAGRDGDVAKYWKNGVGVSLTDGTFYSFATSIAVVSNDVYVAGYDDYNNNESAVYWKNGVAISLTNGLTIGNANSIVVVGDDVYVAGYVSNGSQNLAKYWKNGVEVSLTDGTFANSIAVVDNNVYVAGSGDNNNIESAIYWKNGQKVSLTNGSFSGGAYSIVVVRR